LIEDRIAFGAAAGPLSVQSRLGIKILLRGAVKRCSTPALAREPLASGP